MTVAYIAELEALDEAIPPEFHDDLPMYREAVEAVRSGDQDRLVCWAGESEPWARAYQVVALFDLTAFVTPRVA